MKTKRKEDEYKISLAKNPLKYRKNAAKTYFTNNNSFTPDFSSLGDGKCTFTVRAFPEKNSYSISEESVASEVYALDIEEVADYNEDGNVSVADALILIKNIVDDSAIENGDLNGDGKLGLIDVLRLLKHIIK